MYEPAVPASSTVFLKSAFGVPASKVGLVLMGTAYMVSSSCGRRAPCRRRATGCQPSTRRGRPLRARRRKGLDVHLAAARFIRLVGEVAPVRREAPRFPHSQPHTLRQAHMPLCDRRERSIGHLGPRFSDYVVADGLYAGAPFVHAVGRPARRDPPEAQLARTATGRPGALRESCPVVDTRIKSSTTERIAMAWNGSATITKTAF